MSKETSKKLISAAVLLILALVSVFVISKQLSSPDTYVKSIAYLDEKRATVMELTAASTAASVAISALPGDAATPIATKLADLSSYFLVILCAIFLEKYLLTIIGYFSFRFLVPIACLLLIIYVFHKSEWLRSAAIRVFAFSIAISLVIPLGVCVSSMIEETYSTSISETINASKDATEAIENYNITAETENETAADTKSQGLFDGIATSIKDVASAIGETAEAAKSTVSAGVEKLKTLLSDFIEAIAVLIVTSCIIPILTLLALLWIVKVVTGLDIRTPSHKRSA